MTNLSTLLRGLVGVLISIQLAHSQSVTAKLWRDTLTVSTGQTFTNWLVVRNQRTQPAVLYLTVRTPNAVQLLSAVPASLRLKPGETGTIPLKGLLAQQPTTYLERLTVQLADSAGGPVGAVGCLLVTGEKQQAPLSLSSPDESVVLYSGGEAARVRLRLTHYRLRTQPYTISVQSLPEALDSRHYPLSVQLAGQQDTTLTLTLPPRRTWSVNTRYQLLVTVRDARESIVGTMAYTLLVASSARHFIPTGPGAAGGYGVAAGLTKLSDNQFAREGRVWGSDTLGRGQFAFQLQYLDYSGSSYRQLQNSYLSYRTAHAFVHLGTLFEYHEMPLLGRGLKVQLNQKDQQWSFWAVNTNPNWLDPYANTWAGNIASVRYDRQFSALPNGEWSVSSSYFSQPGTFRAGYLNYATLRFTKPGGHSFDFLAGQSSEYARQGTNPARTPGWAGMINYSLQQPRLRVDWRSYVSTPAYAGLQRGATLINGQVAWLLDNQTSFQLRLNHVLYKQQRFTTASESYRTTFGNSIAEVVINQAFGPFTMTLRPYWQLQSDQTNPFSQRAAAWRLATSATYRSTGNQQATLTYDMGSLTNLSTPATAGQANLLSQRISSSIAIGPFGLWGYWQRGPYYLYDFRSTTPESVITTSVTPTVSFATTNQRLTGTVGLTYLKDGFFDRVQYVAVGRVRYDVSPTCWLRLEGNGTPYSQRTEYAYSQYRLEVTKQFGAGLSRRNGRLQLSFYQDLNGNDQRDPGERWVDSLLVTVNEQTLFTNARGTITYANLPRGTYTVSAISAGNNRQAGDPVQFHEQILLTGNLVRQIPLRQTFRVTGRIRCKSTAYDRQPCDFDRFVVEVQRRGERLTLVGLLPDGTFATNLSPGDYTLRVHDRSRAGQSVIKTTPLTLSGRGQHAPIDWPVDASTRAVEVQRFKSE